MNYVKCPNCGGETPAILSKCRFCGQSISSVKAVEEEAPKARNGFVSFWLWASLVCNILATVGYIALMFSSKGLMSRYPEPFIIRLSWVILSLALVVGFKFLLDWKRNGFFLILIAQGLSGIVSLCAFGTIASLVMCFAPVVVLYLILQIKKNGVSCWDLLS